MAKPDTKTGVDPGASLLANASRLIALRLDAMLAYERYLAQPDRVEELHAMRIAAKRLRYTMEIFQKVYVTYTPFGDAFTAVLNEIKLLQEHLGQLHDADVLVPQLTRQLARTLKDGYGKNKKGVPLVGVHRVDFDASQGLLTLCRETRAARDGVYQQLLRDWERLQTEQTFPRLRALLQEATAPPETSPSNGVQPISSADSASVAETLPAAPEKETPHGEDRATDPSAARPQVARRTRKRIVEPESGKPATSDARRHSRPRPDTGESAPEGRVRRPKLPASG